MAKAKNFLKNIKDVTAPRRWKSSPDHPPAQLAYVTQDEIDMLVEANIYGSMDGKPNRGPKGIISLQGDLGSWRPSRPSPSGGGGSGSGGGSGGGPHGGGWNIHPPAQTGQSGGVAGSGLVPVTSIVPAGVGGGTGTVTTMVPVDQAPPSAGGTGITGITGDGDEETVTPTDDKTLSDKVREVGNKFLGVLTGPEIKKLTPRQLAAATQLLSQYQALGIKNPLKLRSIMMSNIGGALFGKDQTFSDEFGNRVNPDDVIEEDGELVDKKTGNKVRYTKEGIMDLVGRDTLKSLQMHNPELYYPFAGMPQTTGGLESLGQEQTIDLSQFKRGTKEYEDAAAYNQMIFNARQEVDRQQGGQGGGGGGGIMGAVPTPFTDVNNNGILDSLEVAQATTTPEEVAAVTTTTPAMATEPVPIDYSQWPQYQGYPTYGPAGGPVPDYVNQGLGQAPNFDYWNQIANAFPGMRNYG